MIDFIFYCALCIIMLLTPLSITFLSPWNTHKAMVKKSCRVYGKGNFELFKKLFEEINPALDTIFESYFDIKTKTKIHASIIQFNGVGMILGFTDWLKFQKYIKRKIEQDKDNVYGRIVDNYDWKTYNNNDKIINFKRK